jgi:hypothetical protein
MKTGEPEAFKSLSSSCEQATMMGEKTGRDGLVDHVKGVVSDVRKRARDMFKRFFGWTKTNEEASKPATTPANVLPSDKSVAPVQRSPSPF